MTTDRWYLNQQEIGPMQNYVYVIGDAQTKEVAVIDAAWEPDTIRALAGNQGLTIKHVIATHYHFDHVNAAADVVKATGATFYIQAQEINTEFADEIAGQTRRTADGETLQVGGVTLTFIHTPGHTPGSQCILAEGCLFTGDTLFIRGCGRTDLPGGNSEQLFNSLHHVIGRLPDETKIYPGHNYAPEPFSTLASEKQDNIFFQQSQREDFVRYRTMKTLGKV